ncbi:hypothetical protein CHS0354_043031 [Potamilus streckersoni]|uniref:F-box domain-containing protein n=1 Tax=Potamilus streckersoni TaxID=2493646 RepID=A0AAE0VUF8_9BIVA|nr:hypothetical protein CHS0354_043031 [Potamilus streckersoni]
MAALPATNAFTISASQAAGSTGDKGLMRTESLRNPNITVQFAKEVIDFSSQYGTETSISYTARNLAGGANIFPSYGDFTQACVFRTYGPWWKKAPSARKPFERTPKTFLSDDYIEITFATKVYPIKLDIYETYNPGAIVRILACDMNVGTDVDTGLSVCQWVTLWQGRPEESTRQSRIFSPPLKQCPFPTELLRLELCHDLAPYYTDLDCVQLHGTTEPVTNFSCVRLHSEQFYVKDGDGVNVMSTMTGALKDLSLEPNPKEFNTENQYVSKEIKQITREKDTGHEEIKNIKQTNNLDSVTYMQSDNGFFDLLPGEVIQIILSNMDLPGLCSMAQTCRLLRRHCCDSLQYIELNLQPHWTQVTDAVMYSLLKRCSHLQRLNLSWCKNPQLTINGVDAFMQFCGRELTCLYISTCKFVNNDCLMSVAQYCPNLRELDIDSCLQVDSTGFSQLKNLLQLQRLNLYRTYIDTMSLTAIIRSCPNLQHLNLGSCTCLHFMDDIADELGKNCRVMNGVYLVPDRFHDSKRKLKSLELWRSRSISHEGLLRIYTNCRDLEEIDLGWCTELKSRTSCFVELTQNCTKLKKLFLTANRTVCDEDLLAIAKHCKDMEQLDILGTREVSAFAAQRILENCKKLIMFDVSFCSGIDFPMMETWKKDFPHCEIKKSYQN